MNLGFRRVATAAMAAAMAATAAGAELSRVEVEGPATLDLYDEDSAAFRLVGVYDDGSRADLEATWSADSADEVGGMQISTNGVLSFSSYEYSVRDRATATVTATFGGKSATRDVAVFGPGRVVVVDYALSQDAAWPGAEVVLVPRTVRWWRHGVEEAPTTDLAGVKFGWKVSASGGAWASGDGTSFTVPDGVVSDRGTCTVSITSEPDRDRRYSVESRDAVCASSASAVPLRTIAFDAAGGTCPVASVLRRDGSKVLELPVPTRRGHLFDGWLVDGASAPVRQLAEVNSDLSCVAAWSKVESVDVRGGNAAVGGARLALSATLADGTVRDMEEDLFWRIESGDAAEISPTGVLTPKGGASGDVAVRVDATVAGEPVSISRTVRMMRADEAKDLRIEGPEVVDLYDGAPYGRFRAYVSDGGGYEGEMEPEWSVAASGAGSAPFVDISRHGELLFGAPAGIHCATVTVTAVCGELSESATAVVYGPGYVKAASFVASQDAVWPGAKVELVPQTVQWWRHGVLEDPTNDVSGVRFGWEISVPGGGSASGDGTSFTVPDGLLPASGTCSVYLTAVPDREGDYSRTSAGVVCTCHPSSVALRTISLDANGGVSSVASVRRSEGGRLGELPTPVRKGFAFEGWFTHPEFGERCETWTAVSGDVTYYAHWSDPATMAESLFWRTERDGVFAAAKGEGKRILLVAGRDTNQSTLDFMKVSAEHELNKTVLLRDFVLWYSDIDKRASDTYEFRRGVTYTCPIICVIDPARSSEFIARRSGYLSAEALNAFLEGLPAWTPGADSDPEPTPEPTPDTDPDPNPDPDPDPSPSPSPSPTPTPTPTPEPTPGPSPSPSPSPSPTPEPEPDPEAAPVLYESVVGAAPKTASEYNGYLFDSVGNVKGTINVKVGKPNKRTKLASVKATVVVGAKKTVFKASGKGKAKILSDGPTAVALGGGKCEVMLGASGLAGRYDSYAIDGARNFFTSKVGGDVAAANAVVRRCGSVNVVWDGGGVNVGMAARGKVKVKGVLAGGKAKVSAKSVFLIGEEWCCVPVVAPKAKLAFAVWMSIDGSRVALAGMGGSALVGKAGTLVGGAKFNVDASAAAWAKIPGTALSEYLPDGVPVVQSGARWVVAGGARAGKLAMKGGRLDVSKAGKNPSALKLSYKSKDGSFKGSFKVYSVVNGRLKATKATVVGMMVDGVGYGTATIRNAGSVSITIE